MALKNIVAESPNPIKILAIPPIGARKEETPSGGMISRSGAIKGMKSVRKKNSISEKNDAIEFKNISFDISYLLYLFALVMLSLPGAIFKLLNSLSVPA